MFVDEPIWLVYRQLLAREYDTDQSVAIDLFFNTSQCNLQEELWGDDEMVSDWFYKRETHSEGDNTTLTQGFFTRENQTKLCKSLSRHNPPKVWSHAAPAFSFVRSARPHLVFPLRLKWLWVSS